MTKYAVKQGFLWSTPPDEIARSGWVWTDRADLINVMKELPDGSGTQALKDNDPEKLSYTETYNRQGMVMNRLNNYEEYKREINRMLKKRQYNKDLSLINMKLNQTKLIENIDNGD